MTERPAKELVDSAVREALGKAITQEGYVLLVSFPKSSGGLFANRKPPNKKAIEQCLDPSRTLLAQKKPAGSDGKAKTPEMVQITEKGIATLVRYTHVEDFPKLIDSASPPWKGRVLNNCLRAIVKRSSEPSSPAIGSAIQACFDVAQRHLNDLTARLNQILDSQHAIAEAVLAFTSSTVSAFTKESKRLIDEGNLLAEARAQLVSPPPSDAPPSTRRDISWECLQIGRLAQTEAAIDFQRSLSQELAIHTAAERSPVTI
jgi:hypothetical protein